MVRPIFILLAAILFIAFPVIADYGPLETPIKSYSGGCGFVRYSVDGFSNTIFAFLPADVEFVNDRYDWNASLYYGFERTDYYDPETVHYGVFTGGLGFKLGNTDPIRLSLGPELTSYNRFYENGYYALHTLGPKFAFTIPIPLNNSYNEIGCGVGFGVRVEDYHFSYYGYSWYDSSADFIIDLSFSEKIEVMFTDKFGVNFALSYIANVFGPGYGTIEPASARTQVVVVTGVMPNRMLLQVGPVLRW
jgi:hypothetical protein